METLARLFKDHLLLKDLKESHIETLVGCAQNVRFAAGDFLFHEGDEATRFYFVRSGRVALEIHVPGRGAVQIATVGEGGVLGWSWLVPPYRWQSDGRAVEPSRALVLDGVCLREKCDRDHELGYEIMKRLLHLAHRELEATRIQLLQLYGTAR